MCIDTATAGLGYFTNLKHLEEWAEHHSTHLDIFHKFYEIASTGKMSTWYGWHEVFVVDHGIANYYNCHNRTGFLRWYGTSQIENCDLV